MQPLDGSEHYATTAAPLLNGTYARLRERSAPVVRMQLCCNDPGGRPIGQTVLARPGGRCPPGRATDYQARREAPVMPS